MIAASYSLQELGKEKKEKAQYDLRTLLPVFLQNKGSKTARLDLVVQDSSATGSQETTSYADACQVLCRAIESASPGSLEEVAPLFNTWTVVSLVERTTRDCTALRHSSGLMLLHLYSGAPSLRPSILVAVTSHLEQLVIDRETDIVMEELLSVLGSIVADLVLTPTGDNAAFVMNALLPLYKLPALPLWSQRLLNIILLFARRAQGTVVSMVKALAGWVVSANAQSSVCIIRAIGALFDILPSGIFGLEGIVSAVMTVLRTFLQSPVALRGVVFETVVDVLQSTHLAEGVLALPPRLFAVFVSMLRNAISLQWDKALRSTARAIGTCIVENYRARAPYALGYRFKEIVRCSKVVNKEKNARFERFWEILGDGGQFPVSAVNECVLAPV